MMILRVNAVINSPTNPVPTWECVDSYSNNKEAVKKDPTLQNCNANAAKSKFTVVDGKVSI